MKLLQSLPRSLALSGIAAIVALSFALAQNDKEYQPQVGQAGKDVVWVPTPQALVDRMLDMAEVTADDYVVDLGSGDGRTVITAAKRGIKALGIEYNPDMVELSKRNAEREGVGDKAVFVQGDIFESDFSDATVVTMFLLSSLNLKLRPIILDMKPGTRVVSNTFDMGEWQADETVEASGDDCQSYCRAYFWMVPAKVQGRWETPQGALNLDQSYQMVSGNLIDDHVSAPVRGKLMGDLIAFTAGRTLYTGRVNGDVIEGTARSGSGETEWKATRKED